MVTFTPQVAVCWSRMDCSRTFSVLALAQQFVEFHFAQHAAQRGLGKLRSGIQKIGNFQHGLPRIEHAEIDHGVHLDGDVVPRHHVLRGNFQRVDAQRNPHDAIERREYQDHAGPFGLRQSPPQAEDHAAFVFPQNLDGTEQVQTDESQ